MLLILQFSVTIQVMRRCHDCRTKESKWNSFFFSKPCFTFGKNGIYKIKISDVPENIQNISLGFLTKDEIYKIINKEDNRPHSKDYLIQLNSGNGEIIRKIDNSSKRWFVFFPKNNKYTGIINVICFRNELIYNIGNNSFAIYRCLIVPFILIYILALNHPNIKSIHFFKDLNPILIFAILLYHLLYSMNLQVLEFQKIHEISEFILLIIVMVSLFDFCYNFLFCILLNLLFVSKEFIHILIIVYLIIGAFFLIYKQRKKIFFHFENNQFITKKDKIYSFGGIYMILWAISYLFSFFGVFSIIQDEIFILMSRSLFSQKNWKEIKNFFCEKARNTNPSNYNQYNIVEKIYYKSYVTDCSTSSVESDQSSFSSDMSDWSDSS